MSTWLGSFFRTQVAILARTLGGVAVLSMLLLGPAAQLGAASIPAEPVPSAAVAHNS